MDEPVMKVLLVEDEKAHAELMSRAFDPFTRRFQVSIADSLKSAQEALEESTPHLIIADYLLPDGHGTDLLRTVKQRRLPLVIMTSHGNEQVAVEAMKAGVLDYLVKSEFTFLDMPHIAERALREWNHILEKENLQAQINQAQKIEALGTLAGGIAHDFNNLLMAILGNVSLAKMYLEPEHKAYERLEEAERASMRAQELSRQLLTFSRGGAPMKELCSLSVIIRDASAFALSGSNVKCEYDIQQDLWMVEVDRSQMNQVFGNLILNAIQAMPDGGLIHIESRNHSLNAGKDEYLNPGRYVEVCIRDHGIGIREDHLGRVFDPYFTTKQKGSGLGLTTAYSIIKKHEGFITVDSKVGLGTTFRVCIPASERQDNQATDSVEETFFGQGRILVMDDDGMIRNTLGQMLTHLGYEVVLAKEGGEAIDCFVRAREKEKPFDCVIMDLTIPGGMGGKETIKRLLDIDPRVKAIVSSGYSNDPVLANFEEYGFAGVVTKPYRLGELSKVLHNILVGDKHATRPSAN